MTPLRSRDAAASFQPCGPAASGDVAGHDGGGGARAQRHPRHRHRTTLADLALVLQRVEGVLADKAPHHRGAWGRAHSVDADTFDVTAHLPVWREACRQRPRARKLPCSRLLESFAPGEHRTDERVART